MIDRRIERCLDVAVMFGPNSTQWQSSTPTLFLRSKLSAGRIQALAPGWCWLVRGQTNGIKGELSSLIHTGTCYFRRAATDSVYFFNYYWAKPFKQLCQEAAETRPEIHDPYIKFKVNFISNIPKIFNFNIKVI